MKKFSSKIVVGLVLLGLTSLPAYSSTLKEELQKLREAGIPSTIEELNLPEISDEENGALVYKEVFKLLDSLHKKYQKEWKYMPYEGTVEWNKVPEEEKKKVINLILHNSEFAKMYQLLEKASRMKCQFFTKEDYEKNLMDILSKKLFSVLVGLRSCARTSAEKAKIEAEYGEINKALSASLTGLRIGKSLSNNPFLISQLSRNAMDAIALAALEESLNKGEGNINLYQSLISEIENERKNNLIGNALRKELAIWGIPGFSERKKAGKEAFEFTEEDGNRIHKDFPGEMGKSIEENTRQQKETLKEAYLKSGCETPEEFFEKQEILYLKTISKMMFFTEEPHWEAREKLRRIDEEIQKLTVEEAFYTKMLSPSISRAYLQEARIDALLGAAEIGIVNRIHKQKYGKYVNSLTQLTPSILPSLPLDPFTGKNYIYKRKDKGFIVYSVGEDLKEDGGTEGKRLKPDIVWEDKGKDFSFKK